MDTMLFVHGMRRWGLATVLLLAPALRSCSGDMVMEWGSDDEDTSSKTVTPDVVFEPVTDEDDDIANTTFDSTVTIHYDGTTATVADAPEGLTAQVDGAHVSLLYQGTATIKYCLTGSADDGSFRLLSTHRQAIVLQDVHLVNPRGAAVNVQSHKRTFVVVEGSNSLQDGAVESTGDYPAQADYPGEDMKAALFSEGQLLFSGDGTLEVTAVGKNAIASDDYLKMMGTPVVTVIAAAGHGLRGQKAVTVAGGTLDIRVTGDGCKAISSDSLVYIAGGTTTLTADGDAALEEEELKSPAGIKADMLFAATGGQLTISASGQGGKGISCDGNGYFLGGTITVNVTGSNYGSSNGFGPGGFTRGEGGFPPEGDFPPGGGEGHPGGEGFPPPPPGGFGDDGHFPGPPPGGGETRAEEDDNTSSSAKGIKCDGNIVLAGAEVFVTCSNHEAIESKQTMQVTGGTVYAYSSDDAINAASDMTITDGVVTAISTGNDGLDANGNLYIKGGTVYAVGCGSPEVAIDANTEGGYRLYLTGGTVIAVGGIESGSSLTQAVAQTTWSANTTYALIPSGSETPTVAFQTPARGGSGLYVSLPGMEQGTTCTLVKGGTIDGSSVVDDLLWLSPQVSGGTQQSLTGYTQSSGGGMGGGGGFGGGGGGFRW